MNRVRIATRGSELALAQARREARRIEEALGRPTELRVIKTSGDRLRDVPLARLGGKGLFVKEIEEALLEGEADLAVHSAKDLPAVLAPGLVLAAFPERADPRDALVSRRRGEGLGALPRGARVGTGSARRSAQLRHLRPDLQIVPLRGNVPTRLKKLERDDLDAVVLACAGLDRLGLEERIDERIEPDVLLPAVGQGAIALEVRADDPLARDVARLADAVVGATVAAERGFLARLGGDCNVPLAAHARVSGDRIALEALVAATDGSRLVRGRIDGALARAAETGARLAETLLDRGAAGLLEAARREAEA